jgi:hypothetical protein
LFCFVRHIRRQSRANRTRFPYIPHLFWTKYVCLVPETHLWDTIVSHTNRGHATPL